MNELWRLIWCGLIGFFRSRASLEAEILVLRHQLTDETAINARSRRRGDGITTFFAAAQNVCFWHKADIPTRSTNVRFRG
jgi:hypothetical protein